MTLLLAVLLLLLLIGAVASLFFFFNDTATTEIYTLSLHDALPIYIERAPESLLPQGMADDGDRSVGTTPWAVVGFSEKVDRKSTRLNSSHGYISYAVFCLKKNSLFHPGEQLRASGA